MEHVTEGLEHVIMYIDDAITFNSSPKGTCPHLTGILLPLRTHDMKPFVSKVRFQATELDSLGHPVSLAGLHPDTNKVRATTDMPVPTNNFQLRSLLTGFSYYHKFLPNLSERICPITDSLEKGVALS